MTSPPTDRLRDPDRLDALRRSGLLDTPAEDAFDRLTRLASRALGVPVSLVSLVDADRQFFKSALGLPEPWATERQTPLSHSFCRHTLAAGEPFVVEDAHSHPLVRDNLAVPDLGVVAYAGVPLVAGGHVLGAFCAIDHCPRAWSEEDLATLADLAAAAATEIELRAAAAELERRARRAALQVEIASALAGPETEPAVLQRCAEAVVRHLGAVAARIWTLDGDELLLRASAGDAAGDRPGRLPLGESPIGRIAAERRPLLAGAGDGIEIDPARGDGTAAFAGYPLLAGERLVGVIALATQSPLDEATLDALAAVADHVARGLERRRAEEARAHLAAIVESAEDAIVARTLDGVVTSWNRGAERLYGWTAEEVVGRSIALAVPAERAGEVAALSARVARGERVEQFETVRRRKDGSPVEVAITLSPVRDAAGAVVGVATIARDVTERTRAAAERERLLSVFRAARAELAAAHREQGAAFALLDTLLSGAPDGFAFFDRELRYRIVNPALAAFNGLPVAAHLGRRPSEVIPALAPLEALLRRVLESAEPAVDHEVGGETPATPGEPRFWLVSCYPVRDAAGETIGVGAVVVEITARKRAEADRERLLARERAARAEAESAVAALGRLQTVTDAALAPAAPDQLLAALVARLRETLAADSAAVFLLSEDGSTLEIRAADCWDGEEAIGFRLPLGEGFAGRVAAERRLLAVEDAEGEGLLGPSLRAKGIRSLLGAPLLVEDRLLGVVHVGTRRPRRFGEDDRRLLAFVADRLALVVDRVRLDEAERRARAAAEEAVRARDRFLSIAAHELRTPVTSIRGYAQLALRLLARGATPDRLAPPLRTIDDATERLARLTDDLLDVSRLRLGQLPLRPRPLDLVALVRDVVDRHRARLGDAHPVLIDAAPAGPVVADPDRLEQVLTNLLDNAAKYSPDGGPIRVVVRSVGDGVELRVRDEGIGLPPGAAETVFEPFGRALNAAARNLPGMGLGLYICRGIVERHGGRIRAESEGEGRGTVVIVWLPCAVPEAGDAGDPAAVAGGA